MWAEGVEISYREGEQCERRFDLVRSSAKRKQAELESAGREGMRCTWGDGQVSAKDPCWTP